MAANRPSGHSLATVVASVTGLVAMIVAYRTGASAGVDRAFLAPPISLQSNLGQIAAAFALLTSPVLVYLGLGVVAIWAYRRRLRHLATALALSIVLGGGGQVAIGVLLHRDRPPASHPVLSAAGYAMPSGHVTAASVAAVMVITTVVVTRQDRRVAAWWQVLAVVGVVLVAGNRWLMSAHWVSDIIGGLCWGVAAATASLMLASVTVIPRGTHRLRADGTRRRRRCAVIFNPTKVTDEITFRRHVEFELSTRGFERAIWLPTSPQDPGVQMTAIARRKQVDLVLGAGGDGTIRTICSGLAGSGIPLGVIAAGTGNLLARNLGIPLDERAALEVAFDGHDELVDLIETTADDDPTTRQRFTVMGGIGIDAAIISNTNNDLKKAVGSAAYFLSAAQNARHEPVRARFSVDGGEPFTRRASVIIIGNVGFLQGGIPLIPDARPNDGLFDLMVVSPANVRDWVRLVTRVMTRQRGDDEQLDRITGSRVDIEVDREEAYELDGDTVGRCRKLSVQVLPGALRVRLPR